jgi:addiction module HigA family antidote
MRPIHPGEILREEYLGPLGLSANQLALGLHVPANRVTAILNEERGVTADTALRLARYFKTTADFWLNMQQAFELRTAEVESGEEIERTVRPPVGDAQDETASHTRPSRTRKFRVTEWAADRVKAAKRT